MFLQGPDIHTGEDEALGDGQTGTIDNIGQDAAFRLLVEGEGDFVVRELRCIAVPARQVQHDAASDDGLRQHLRELLSATYALAVYEIADALTVQSSTDAVCNGRILPRVADEYIVFAVHDLMVLKVQTSISVTKIANIFLSCARNREKVREMCGRRGEIVGKSCGENTEGLF